VTDAIERLVRSVIRPGTESLATGPRDYATTPEERARLAERNRRLLAARGIAADVGPNGIRILRRPPKPPDPPREKIGDCYRYRCGRCGRTFSVPKTLRNHERRAAEIGRCPIRGRARNDPGDARTTEKIA